MSTMHFITKIGDFFFGVLLTKWLTKLNLKVAGKGKLNRLFVKDCLIIINISGLSTS